MGSAATFEGALPDVLEPESLEEVAGTEGVGGDQLADGLPDEQPEPDPDDPYAGLTAAEIREKVAAEVRAEAEKDFEARKEQALKDQRAALDNERRTQAEMARLIQERQLASQQGINATTQALMNLYQQAADSNDGLKPEMVQQIAGQLYTGIKRANFEREVVAPALERLRPYGIQIDPEFQGHYSQGVARQDPALVQYAVFESLRRATYAEAWAAFQKAEAAKAAENEKAAGEAKKLASERRAAAGSVQPTNARGAAASNPRAILDTAPPGSKAYLDAFEKVHGYRP